MKMTFFEISKKTVFPQLFEELSNGPHVALTFILGVNQDVIQADNDKNIEFFGQNLDNVALKAGQCIR